MKLENIEDETSTTRMISALIMGTPLIEIDATVGKFSRKGIQKRIYRYRLTKVVARQKDGGEWSLSVVLHRMKVDGTRALKSSTVVTTYSEWDLQRHPVVRAARDLLVKEKGLIGVKQWSQDE